MTLKDICRHLGLILTICLSKAFAQADPKRVRIQSSLQYLFALLGSAGIKAARKILMKLTPADS